MLPLTDKRVSIMSEMLIAIRLIKFYAWEEPRANQVAQIRQQDLSLLRKGTLIQQMSEMMGEFISSLALFGAISCYVLTSSTINVTAIFTTLV